MSCAREDLPHRAHHVPRNQHRQRHHHQRKSDQPAASRYAQSDRDAERHLDQEAGEREGEGAKQGVVEARADFGARVQEIAKPAVAVPEEIVRAHRVLDRVVHDGHDRNDRREQDKGEDRQNEKPRAIVDRLAVHAAAPVTRTSST